MKTDLRRWLCVALVFAAVTPALAAPETYTIDPAHSTIGFRVKHFFTKVSGRFAEVNGTITVDPDRPESASVEATIKVASINTANGKRDEDLRSANFFDAPRFPEITFKSRKVKVTGKDAAIVIGDLTIHGVSKEIPLKVEFLGKGKGMQGQEISGWQASTTINRRDFGLTWSKVVEGVAAVGDDVDIELSIEAPKK